MYTKKLLLTITLFLAFIGLSLAQAAEPFVIGESVSLQSAALHEERVLNIYLPDGYAQSHEKYPIIYLLDGSANEDFIHVVGIVQFLTMINVMQPTVIVGIANVDRKRDFTFPTRNQQDQKDFPTTGHAADFIDFLKNEAIPFVNKHYRLSDNTTIIGQSFGGLLAAQLLVDNADLFKKYVIVSPSLWWDDESLLQKYKMQIATLPLADKKIYVAVGKEGRQMEGDAKQLVEVLKTTKNKNCQVKFAFMPAETHLTILHNCVYNALSWLQPTPAKE